MDDSAADKQGKCDESLVRCPSIQPHTDAASDMRMEQRRDATRCDALRVSSLVSARLRVTHLILMLAQNGLDVVFHGGGVHG